MANGSRIVLPAILGTEFKFRVVEANQRQTMEERNPFHCYLLVKRLFTFFSSWVGRPIRRNSQKCKLNKIKIVWIFFGKGFLLMFTCCVKREKERSFDCVYINCSYCKINLRRIVKLDVGNCPTCDGQSDNLFYEFQKLYKKVKII